MRITDVFHLTYCTNIHPGQDWQRTFESIKRHVPRIRSQVAKDQAFGLGLRLSNKASEELGHGEKLESFRNWLEEQDVYVFTMNGFPYGNFHDERVKEEVHTPDWTTPERVAYTKRLFKQLAYLLPEGLEGGISTSPIGYRHRYASNTSQLSVSEAFQRGAEHMTEILLQLIEIESRTGKYLHLDIEPEPDGLLENSDETITFFKDYLLPTARPKLEAKGLTPQESANLVRRHITLCYDICHFALAYEEPEDTFAKLARAGIGVGKIQVSAALKILSGSDAVWDTLSLFDEPTYLHQVTEKIGDKVKTYNDLPIVLQQKKPFKELRAHFHVPIFLERFGVLYATQDHILKTIKYLKNTPVTRHLEIETYTWDVLPPTLKKDLSESIVREIEWFQRQFQ